jgi:leucyl aminopeptidase
VAQDAGLDVAVYNADRLAAEGLGGLLAVGAAARGPARLVTASYDPAAVGIGTPAVPRHIVLVGSGLTYDTGGLAIWPRETMARSTAGRSGAAVALAAVAAAREAGVPWQVTAVLPIAEHGFGAGALRPGDVVRTAAGRLVEIVDPRSAAVLAVADALAWAGRELAPDVAIDIVPATRAARVALGMAGGALFTADEPLARAFAQASAVSGERAWRLPLVEEYRDATHSRVADTRLADVGDAGAITAAWFLQGFVRPGLRWAHLDTSGPVFAEGSGGARSGAVGAAGEGSTCEGFGARLLARLLEDLATA